MCKPLGTVLRVFLGQHNCLAGTRRNWRCSERRYLLFIPELLAHVLAGLEADLMPKTGIKLLKKAQR